MKNQIPASQQIPIFQNTYHFYISWYVRCQVLPKRDRFTLGQKTESMILEILTLIVCAYHSKHSKQKKEYLLKINSLLECTKITMRLAKDVKAIDLRWYIEYEERLQEIGKMLGGWINSLSKTDR